MVLTHGIHWNIPHNDHFIIVALLKQLQVPPGDHPASRKTPLHTWPRPGAAFPAGPPGPDSPPMARSNSRTAASILF